MDQTARIEDGSGNIIVQAVASSVTLGQPAQLKLSPRHRRKRAPKPGVDIDLLNPFTDAIPFIGREKDLARLEGWLANPKPISARSLIGRAGTGKTRLALRTCELAEALPTAWDAGFVEHRELERFASLQNLSAWSWQRPTLIVIDYAAGVTRWLRPWLEELAQNPGRNGVPLRLLMLERFADEGLGWWDDLTRTGQSHADVPTLFDPPKPEELHPIGAEYRIFLVRAIMRAVRPNNADSGSGESKWVEKLVERGDAVDAIDLMMAGLIAARQLAPAEDGRPWSRTAMATGVARHERSRIERLAKDRNVSPATLEHLVAMVTLGGGIAIDTARPMIEEELTALPRRDSGSALDVCEVLQDALREKERGRLPPIVPDLIGEAFVIDAFGKLTPAEQSEVVARSYRRAPEATAATVIRTVQDFAKGEDHPALRWLDSLVGRCASVADLMPLADSFPDETVALREQAAAVMSVIANHLRSVAQRETESDRALLAWSLNALSLRLGDLGRREEALAAIEEAVAIRRELASLWPDAFRPYLAMSLNNIAKSLSELGRREEALPAIEEAVAVYRELAALQPDAFRPYLAESLNNLALSLSDLGPREEALAAIEEAVAVRRELASLRPDAFRPDLARSLAVLGDCREAMGSLDQAMTSDREAVATLLPYLQRWPDRYAELMSAVCAGYLRRCEMAGVEPDMELLALVVEVFQRLQGVDAETLQEDGRQA